MAATVLAVGTDDSGEARETSSATGVSLGAAAACAVVPAPSCLHFCFRSCRLPTSVPSSCLSRVFSLLMCWISRLNTVLLRLGGLAAEGTTAAAAGALAAGVAAAAVPAALLAADEDADADDDADAGVGVDATAGIGAAACVAAATGAVAADADAARLRSQLLGLRPGLGRGGSTQCLLVLITRPVRGPPDLRLGCSGPPLASLGAICTGCIGRCLATTMWCPLGV